MKKIGQKIVISEEEASGGTKPHILRYMLAVSLVLAILAMSGAWIAGAFAA